MPKATKPCRVIVEIRGGSLAEITTYGDVEVIFMDWDSIKSGDVTDLRGAETFRHTPTAFRTKGKFQRRLLERLDEAALAVNAAKIIK